MKVSSKSLMILLSILVIVIGVVFVYGMEIDTVSMMSNDNIVDYYLGDSSDHLSKDVKISAPLEEHCVGVQKSWTTASILSLIMGGLGIDQLYIGHIGKGILKLFIGVALFGFTLFRCCFTFAFDTQKFNRKNTIIWLSFTTLVTILSVIQFLLWIMDLVLVMTNSVQDGNNCPLSYSS